jgi:hypothetical protein
MARIFFRQGADRFVIISIGNNYFNSASVSGLGVVIGFRAGGEYHLDWDSDTDPEKNLAGTFVV